MLHVANGDAAAHALRAAGLEVAVWADCLDQGPVVGDPATPAFLERRAHFLAGAGCGTLAQIRVQLAEWTRALRPDATYWFEGDLNCMLALAHHVKLFPDARVAVSAKPVSGLTPEEIRALQPRTDLGDAAARAWSAITAPAPGPLPDLSTLPDPSALRNLSALRDPSALPDLSTLPALQRALARLRDELPEPRSGLSRTERQILEAGARFEENARREEEPWLTDFFFERIVRTLQDGGLLDGREVTALGLDVLAGRADWLERAPERWVGGICVPASVIRR